MAINVAHDKSVLFLDLEQKRCVAGCLLHHHYQHRRSVQGTEAERQVAKHLRWRWRHVERDEGGRVLEGDRSVVDVCRGTGEQRKRCSSEEINHSEGKNKWQKDSIRLWQNKPDQARLNQKKQTRTKPDQNKPDQTRTDQNRPDQNKPGQTGTNQTRRPGLNNQSRQGQTSRSTDSERPD